MLADVRFGSKGDSGAQIAMSALPPKTDIERLACNCPPRARTGSHRLSMGCA